MLSYTMKSLIYSILLLQSISALASSITDEQKIVAITLLAEARGEGNNGMGAVCAVIQQRAIERKQTARQVAQEAETINGEFVSAVAESAKNNSISIVGTMYEKSRKKDRVYDTSFNYFVLTE